jgi:site-specific DNA recombinase
VHTPLIDDETFTAAHDLLAARGRGPTEHQAHRTRNHYIFRGKMICGLCSRKMQGQQTHGEPYYRCRYPEEYALANRVQHPRNVILREADLIAPLDTWLTRALAPHRLEATITAMIDAADTGTEDDAQAERARQVLRECDAKLARYRAALDAGGDPAAIAEWTNEVKAQKIKAQAQLRAAPRRRTAPSRADIKALITGLGDLTKSISGATPQEKTAVYHALGIQGTYHPAKRRVRVEANLDPHLADAASPRWEMVRVRGGT